MKNKFLAFILVIVMMIGVLPAGVSAAEGTPFINNAHWKEVSDSELNQKYNNKESFVAMFFRTDCTYSNLRKVMIENWMNMYNLDIYGVNCDFYYIPGWAFRAINATEVKLPVICIIDSGTPYVFTAADSMKIINKHLQEYLGVYDEKELDFSRLNKEIFGRYSIDESNAKSKYCMSESEIPSVVVSEAKNAVKGISSEREKLKAIYDWITTNIYYNYGMLSGSVPRRTSVLETYLSRSSVCSGYANLTAAMCNAVGIPCRVVNGFAAGVDTESTVNDVWGIYNQYIADGDLQSLRTKIGKYSNHAWNEAYIDGKWIILDTTWGSNNDYYPESDRRISGTPTDMFFDPNIDNISESHLFWTDYSDGMIQTETKGDINGDGAVNNKDITRLMRYVKYKDVSVSETLCDVNGDGFINNKDITRLMRFVKYRDVQIN